FDVLQDQEYHFRLTGASPTPGAVTDSPPGVHLTLTDAVGTPVEPLPQTNPNALFAVLAPGRYIICISRDAADGPAAAYDVLITFLNNPENPPPISVGGALALQIRLSNGVPPLTGPNLPPPVTVLQPPTVPQTNPLVSTVGTVATTTSTAQVPADLAPLLRADLVGGVTSGISTLDTFVPPPQIQRLENPA